MDSLEFGTLVMCTGQAVAVGSVRDTATFAFCVSAASMAKRPPVALRPQVVAMLYTAFCGAAHMIPKMGFSSADPHQIGPLFDPLPSPWVE